ncbi:MAG: LysR family transcriptional regulator [Rubrivivax sp.]|nr:LysR family transcriptional regulator [Rubrivivax sp.]
MSRFDRSGYRDLNGQLLELLLAVREEGSITRAAQRLGVTQSAVSHLLDKLRAIVGDPLFVKSGRGIVATARADELADRARDLLDELRGFAASGAPAAELLRDRHCQLVITPRPPEGSDIIQKRLFEDRYQVFFDGSQREAPASVDDYLAAEHVSVLYEPRRMLDIDQLLSARGMQRRFAVLVPGFSGVAPFLRGSSYLATLPSLLSVNLLRGFSVAPLPVACPAMPMYMVWHVRHHEEAAHRWLRGELERVVAPSLAGGDVRTQPPRPVRRR